MKRIFFLGLLMSLVSCKDVSKNSISEIELDTAAVMVDTTSDYVSTKINEWEYNTEEDKMTSTITKYATITSNESLSLDFPYEGLNMGHLLLRKKKGELDIIIRIDKGQISTSYDNQNIEVRFDNNKATTFSYLEPTDNSSDVIFISNTTRFISKLKKSKKTLIALPLYQGGTQILEFNTENLKW